MKKINFEDAIMTKPAQVTINSVTYDIEDATYQGGTNLNADTFNTMQTNIEENINKIEDSINEKRSAIFVYNSKDTTVKVSMAWATYKLPFSDVKVNIGNKFTLENGEVKYSGNRPVKVTIHIERNSKNTGNIYLKPLLDGSPQESAIASRPYATNVNIYENNKSFGAWFSLNVSGDAIFTGGENSYMIVEEL